MSRMRYRELGLLLAVYVLSCSGGLPPAKTPEGAQAVTPGSPPGTMAALAADTAALVPAHLPPGLEFELRPGMAVQPAEERVRNVPGTRVSNAEADRLLAQLPSLPKDDAVDASFAKRPPSLPPPTAVAETLAPFPAAVGAKNPPAPARMPLEVVRVQPTGDVPIAPELLVAFNQPMVVLASHADSAASVPVTLAPQPPGKWRWLGTRTLAFTPEERLPMATEYTVTVAKGTRSADGSALAQPLTHSFRTPPPQLVAISVAPERERTRLQPVVVAQFDQMIDRAALVQQTRFCPDSGGCLPAREATPAELAAEPSANALWRELAAEQLEPRALAIVPARALPYDSHVAVRFGQVPSAEGPRRGEPITSELVTHGRLRVRAVRCGYDSQRCAPNDPWQIEFTNPIAEQSLELGAFGVAPSARHIGVTGGGDSIYLQLETRARTRYTLTVPAGVRDVFGQTLGAAEAHPIAVGDPRPELQGLEPITVLDPRGRRELQLTSIGVRELRVRVQPVEIADYGVYSTLLSQQKSSFTVGGEPVAETALKIADPLANTITAVDLSAALPGGLGHAIVVVEPTHWPDAYKPSLRTWVQSSQLGLDVLRDQEHLYAWVTRLADGRPVPDAEVAIEPGGKQGKTDARGFVRLPLPANGGTSGRMAIVRLGNDTVFYPERQWNHRGQPSEWRRRAAHEELRWFAFDDRGAYRPGETVNLKGWLRATEGGQGGKLVVPSGVARVEYKVTSSGGHQLGRGQAELSAAGGFDFRFALPREVDLGYAQVELSAHLAGREQTWTRAVLVEEFRRPEFEVTLHAADAVHFAGDVIPVRTEARYYTGGGLAGAPVEVTVHAERSQFTPPNRSDYAFGEPQPWWFWDAPGPSVFRDVQPKTLRARTDGRGDAAIEIVTGRADPAYPHSLNVYTSVRDVNRQTWSDQTTLLVHPASTYVGLRLARAFVSEGEALDVDVVTVDLDGKDVPGRKVEIRGMRRETVTDQGKTTVHERDVQTCAFTSTGATSRCTFRPAAAGSYEIVARVYDDRGRPNQTQVVSWVAGARTAGPQALDAQTVQIIPDRKEYAPGDVAELLLLPPFYPAEALVTYERGDLLRSEFVRLNAASHTLRVPIAKEHAPTLHVRVLLAGERTPQAGAVKIPAFAQGMATLPISLADKRLQVQVQPDAAEVEPGGKTQLQVDVRDAAGQPVSSAEVAVVVVDEAVLALTEYTPGDPLAAMYPFVYSQVEIGQTRPFVRLRETAQLMRLGSTEGTIGRGAGGGIRTIGHGVRNKARDASAMLEEAAATATADGDRAAGGAVRARPNRPMLRANFSPIALFAPKLATDTAGRARVALALPDDLTRYRVFALASAGSERFGHGESAVTARKPLMVRPTAPRFLNFGDRFELPIVVENQTARAQSVLVAVRAANAQLPDGRGRRVQVPARDRIEVRLPVATRAPGRALLQIAAQSARAADAAQVELPVWTPGTDEAFATYGSLDDERAVAQPLTVPADAFVEFGGLEIGTSSTQVAALTDAVLYVDGYPFDCSEQLASRIITLLALRDVLSAFAVDGVPSAEQARARTRDDALRLWRMQNDDGGFPYWQRGQESSAYNTVHVLHALVRARAAGLPELDIAIERARDAIPALLRREPPAVVRTLRAYTAYVDMLRGRDPGAEVERLFREVKPREHSVEAQGFMLSAIAGSRDRAGLARELIAALQARASETASTAQFNESYSDGAHVLLHSEQRSDAIALEGLMRAAPQNDLVPKLAKGLLAHRKKGRWLNTQENVFAALALRAYFDHHERETPAFEARAFLGTILAQSARYQGRTTEQTTTRVPMQFLAQEARGPLVLHKLGKGRMYYRLGLRYAPRGLALPPENQGFEVERSYEGADDPGDVSRDEHGVWHVKAGARVRVRVAMIAKTRRYHVALVDPLAAGFEPIQANLRVNAAPPDDSEPQPWSCVRCKIKGIRLGPWYEHENLRDDRAEAFTALLPEGVYAYAYTVRATTPGEYVVPPAKAEEMYMPETFGRSASDRVIVR